MAEKKTFVFKLPVKQLADIAPVFCDIPYSLFFDSADSKHKLSRFSYLLFHPFEKIETRNDQTSIINAEQQITIDGNPFNILKARIENWGVDLEPQMNGFRNFQGGAAGYFGYDLARSLEKLPDLNEAPDDCPDMAVGLYDKVIIQDHKKKKVRLLVLATSEKEAMDQRDDCLALLKKLKNKGKIRSTPIKEWVSGFTKERYENSVQKLIDYIYAGDVFQANLSQQFSASKPADFDSYAHYQKLRRVNAAPFAAYMNFGDVQISSSSPEQFLSVHERQVETRPIKGTRPRFDNKKKDQASQKELLNNEKERSENTMIVDLLRNDISKNCEDFSVRTPELCGLESFAAVHHLVSTVIGTLRGNRSPIDLLEGCFPGGSITGAPKVRAMEIIEELEPVRRGPYCGAMGLIGFNGMMETNIMIRSVIYGRDTIRFNVGGGIVADSDPAAEYQETLDKAAAIFESFGTDQETVTETQGNKQVQRNKAA